MTKVHLLQEIPNHAQLSVDKNPWVRTLPAGSRLVAFRECYMQDDTFPRSIVVSEQESPEFDVKLQVLSGRGSRTEVKFEFSSEKMSLAKLECPHGPFLVTAWSSGPGVRIVLFTEVDGKVAISIEETTREYPELADLDNDGVEEVLITSSRFDNRHGQWVPNLTRIYKWDGRRFKMVASRPWERHYEPLTHGPSKR